MATVSPQYFDSSVCAVKPMADGDKVAVKHIPVSAAEGNLLSAEPDGLAVTADDFVSSEEGNLLKKSDADGGALLKAGDIIADEACNILSITNDGKVTFHVDDLISTVEGGNVLGVNPDDCKLFINPCLLPGPQNIVSKDEDNLIVEDPEDCSALLKYRNVVSEDAGNLIQPGSDGKLSVNMSDIVDKGYIGDGLIYIERQDGSHVLQVAACDGLHFESGTVEDSRGNTYEASWLKVNLDSNQSFLFFKNDAGRTDSFASCDKLSFDIDMNAAKIGAVSYLRLLGHGGAVYKSIPFDNGLEALANGGITINTLDALGAGTSDKPISAKAIRSMIDPDGEGGLVWDSDNLLAVDFTKMPTDKMEKLLNSLHIPVYLTKNTNFYVDINNTNAKDVFSEEVEINGEKETLIYGRTRERPWKTLKAAADILATNYNMSKYVAYLNVMPVETDSSNKYYGPVPLGAFARTTGYVVIRTDPSATTGRYNVESFEGLYEASVADNGAPASAADYTGQKHATAKYTASSSECFDHTGGRWYVDDCNMKLTVNPYIGVRAATGEALSPAVRNTAVFPSIVHSTDSTGAVVLRRCNYTFIDATLTSASDAAADYAASSTAYARLLDSAGGHILLSGDSNYIGSKVASSKLNATWLYVENNGLLEMVRSSTNAFVHTVSSDFNLFCYVGTGGIYRLSSVSIDPIWSYTTGAVNNTTGKRYEAASLGTINTGITKVSGETWDQTIARREAYFPGDVDGTMALQYGSWVSPLEPDGGDNATVGLFSTKTICTLTYATGDNYSQGMAVLPSAGTWMYQLPANGIYDPGTAMSTQAVAAAKTFATDADARVAFSTFVGNNTSGTNQTYSIVCYKINSTVASS